MSLVRKPSLKFGQKPRNEWSANAATVECALPIRTASNGIFARPINRMDDDTVQAALATVCAHVQRECRDDVLVQLRKQRQAANQRALVARRKTEQLQLEVAFLRMINDFLMKQLRKLNGQMELAMHMLQGLGMELGLAAQP